MTKDELLAYVTDNKATHEGWYLSTGPDKHEQEDHYTNGVSVVEMNVGLLTDWLECEPRGEELYDTYHGLPKADRRAIWEASDFHYGIFGYQDDDADFWWGKQPD